MDVWRITVAALRRWYILLPLLALTGYATLTVGDGVRPQYQVTATATLVPGSVGTEIPSPYGGIVDTTGVLAIVLDNTSSRDQIEALGLNPAYEAAARTRSALIDISVLSDTPDESLETAEAVLELARQELADRQGAVGIPPRAQLGLQVLQAPSVSDVVSDGKARNMAIVGIVGAALSLLLAVLFDDIVGLVRRWRVRRRERAATKRQVIDEGSAQDGLAAGAHEPVMRHRPNDKSETEASPAPEPSRPRRSRDLARAHRDG